MMKLLIIVASCLPSALTCNNESMQVIDEPMPVTLEIADLVHLKLIAVGISRQQSLNAAIEQVIAAIGCTDPQRFAELSEQEVRR